MPPHTENVIRAIGESLKLEVHSNVSVSTHTEFLEMASVPAIILYYPRMEPYTPNETNEKRITKNTDNTTTIRPPKIFKNLVFDLELISDSILGDEGVANLQEKMLVWIQNNGIITVDAIEYDIQGTVDDQPPRFNANTNIKKIRGGILVEGVEIDSGKTETGYQVLERTAEMQDKETGETKETISKQSE